ncbi:2-oxoglutarate dehydrogenase E1 component [Cerasicoccus arenae]|uniref:oxoglutarate dehydrogenase (succinyl-transferring) n=1 Tax=Cerasicoccus arenae TaxID=424488 RepID=A0A8J3DG94_9BACT|nr:2-oxoglutarate dehydrogenase E1 component [Cerasicoccus arenae]MBK1859149.1 2-oxoglutarate dehydrogenase E1 component [Cerasicoccus arenae]GHB98141.1 2-oxoglutarate dehydrogenase subunit E1 [Cerasicoccus arenae]
MKNLGIANRWNADLIDQNYEQWLDSPDSLDDHWRAFFEGFELAQQLGSSGVSAASSTTPESLEGLDAIVQSRVIGAVYAYRSIGHTQAHFNPLVPNPVPNPRLSLERLGLDHVDTSREYHTGNYLGGVFMPVSTLLERLSETYCAHVGCEYIHIQETPKRRWIQSAIEPTNFHPEFTREEKLRMLDKVMQGEIFERFLHTRYVGQKRFSLEGAETLIAALDLLIQDCPKNGVEEIVMGMAHRGRLNVLANILGKSYQYLFREFSENYIPESIHGDGDVKYHLGFESTLKTLAGPEIELRLAANPSHLEAVDPVVEGKARARQRIRGDLERKRVLPLLIHGDAAFAGQGVVAETFNLAKLKGYRTGGTIHVVINNQIGFTTDPRDSRSSRYCTDIAKMIDVPIFHVNGDDPLAVCSVMRLAAKYRQEFADDVVIDMYCYRRHGHNESDEPGFTQPDLYQRLSKHPAISEALKQRLISEQVISEQEADQLTEAYQKDLNDAFLDVKKEEEKNSNGNGKATKLHGSSGTIQPPYDFKPAKTGLKVKDLRQIARRLTDIPGNFKANSKIARQLAQKWKNFEKGEGIDWSFAESLAFGALLMDGTPVRLSGQDSERGTFSQRHTAWYDSETRTRYVPLVNLDPNQATFCVHNSSLSEAAILGFDYGYSIDYPDMLAIWEAQFGDFANGAQVHFDQFIASSESKWGRMSGLVMLLPHGYEGQGPEHSSARLERYLQACAENNIQVAMMTTPAQYFHIIRRQKMRTFQKPLIIMAPKSLLRHKLCVSTVEELTDGVFHEILDDNAPPKKAERVVFCSGKVYYDLIAYREENAITNTAIVRVEQLYPFNEKVCGEILAKYKGYKQLVWCQEEPQNMGAWNFIYHYLKKVAGVDPIFAGRYAAASPAPGSLAIHKIEQQTLVEEAFGKA